MQNWGRISKFFKQFLLLGGLLFALINTTGQVFDQVVAADSSGDYTSIQAALNAVPDNSSKRTRIFVLGGTYHEKVNLTPSKINVSLIGEDPEKVIISWDDYAGKNGMSGADSYTFLADATDFYAENISFVNTAGPVGQAVAIRTTGDRMVFKNCNFIGNQDTYYAHKRRQYNLLCRVEGTTDFVYGDATTVFDKSEVNCKKSGGSYITAPADTKLVSNTPEGKFYHGLLFLECNVTAEPNVSLSSYSLGRPWQPDASSVFIQCILGDHIKPAGWSTWEGNNHLSGCYAEYLNVDSMGNPVDVSMRVSWSKQLSQEEVKNYYNLGYFLKKDNVVWDPVPITWSLPAPENVQNDGSQLTWNEVANAVGYVIYRNDSAIGLSETGFFELQDIPSGEHEFSAKSVSENGNLSGFPNEPALYTNPLKTELNQLLIRGNRLVFNEEVDFSIYAMNGLKVMEGNNAENADLSGILTGIYIVRYTDKSGNLTISKIAWRTF